MIGVIGAVALLLGPVATADAEPIAAGTAGAFGATITVGGETVIPPTPEQTTELPPGGDNRETVIDIPADPVAVSGTLTADAAVHEASDLESTLATEGTTHTVEGPYNARGMGVVEELDVLLDAVDEGVSLLTADVVRAEAVGVCNGETVEYSANSEIVNLRVGGEEIPLNAPVQDLVDAIGDLLAETGLNAVVDVQRNVVTVDADGASVDALVVTVLAAAGDDPLAQVRIAHAEVSGLTCATPEPVVPAEPEPAAPGLPRTGTDSTVALTAALGLVGLGLVARRFRTAT